MMRVRFWGTRGSIPVALTAGDVRRKLLAVTRAAIEAGIRTTAELEDFIEHGDDLALGGTFGGHTSCVELLPGGNDVVVCDMGSGARPLGESVMRRAAGGLPPLVHVFMSHVHWDHIMGFPFFTPAYVRGARIRIYGCNDVVEQAFRLQQSAPCFPVSFEQLAADIEFVRLSPGVTRDVAGMHVTPLRQLHAGESYGYRFTCQGRSVVYSTDSEHKLEDAAQASAFVELFRDADLVIFDAMYSLADSVSVKEDWGHSSNMVGVELCQAAGARHLCLFHHEPANDDGQIEGILRDTLRLEQLTRSARPLRVSAAYDGLEIEL
jgi:phosphoribosyl 1,2-cyclic phosphodiesterase